jgi:hypothetical protein
MIVYRITNILSSSISIEDLGIRLDSGQSVIISADSHARSEDLRRNDRWIRSDTIHYPNNVKPPTVHRKVLTVQEPIRKNEPVDSGYVRSLKIESKLDDIQKMLSKMMNDNVNHATEIKKKIDEVPTPAVVPYRPGMVQSHEYKQQFSSDSSVPMFIPSKVIPDIDISGTKTSNTEIDKDVESTLDALKKLRKK